MTSNTEVLHSHREEWEKVWGLYDQRNSCGQMGLPQIKEV